MALCLDRSSSPCVISVATCPTDGLTSSPRVRRGMQNRPPVEGGIGTRSTIAASILLQANLSGRCSSWVSVAPIGDYYSLLSTTDHLLRTNA
jgi:hypothetical protein